MRRALMILAFLISIGPGIARADDVAGTIPAGSGQGRLVPDVSTMPMVQYYGQYLASVGHPPVGLSDMPQPSLKGGTADTEVRGTPIQLHEVEAERPTIAESLATDQRLPPGPYVRHESGLDWGLGGGWRLVGNDGIAQGRPETFAGLGYNLTDDVVVAVRLKIRGEEAPEEEHHGPRALPVGLSIQTRW